MILKLGFILFLIRISQNETNTLVPNHRSAKIYEENSKKYIGMNFKYYDQVKPQIFEPNALYIKLVPTNFSRFFELLKNESELVLPINILTNSTNIRKIDLTITLLTLNTRLDAIDRFEVLETRIVMFSRGLIESFTLPQFDMSTIQNQYIKVDVDDITESTPKALKIDYQTIPHALLVMKYVNLFKKFLPSYRQTRSDRPLNKALPCRRTSLFVDFKSLGWNSWIVIPRAMEIYQCVGHCDYSSSFHVEMSDNAIVRSLLHHKGLHISKPCCVPKKLEPVNVVIRNNDGIEEYKIKKFVVDSCGCQ
ncbi:Bone morphogenetic protein 10 [Thelohanellus kitauei]|uniref:Bone morphogenetic protein 10 n=1 Tax=Thelohanellus kitauei TaxID=669202 RepID=A0A0C2IZ76_THEKT|nr:Bone morphogenetic protein 10 [Thelohanellus kitauei]